MDDLDTEPPAAPFRKIDRPGLHNIPFVEYHNDPVEGGSLSRSEAMLMLPPNCPALYEYRRRNREPATRCMDLGSAAHKSLLGAGPEVVPLDFDNYKTKKAQQQRDEAHEAGKIPLLAKELDVVDEMVDVLQRHPTARALTDPGLGVVPELTMVWWDKATGIGRRCMVDAMPPTPPPPGQRLHIGDYKTCAHADDDSVSKAAHKFGYHMQAAQIIEGAMALGLHGGKQPVVVFIFQEKTPPYLVNVVELDAAALRIGMEANRMALELYAECSESGVWPGYHKGVARVPLPRWVENEWGEEHWK